ncbi:MAG: membrane protein insertase YidC [Clostridia bacterium]|nr:membrane protein insertase YidC [Clostridia bacterium]
MSFANIIDSIFLGPLKLVFELIFNLSYIVSENVWVSIILLSLAMNFLVLPLYMSADRMQDRAKEIEAKLRPGIQHIKKTFKGDERMMMLQTYYRQNNYSPLSALSGSVSLLLEIPFFMAAYQFLSNVGYLNGASMGIISDLSKPDALFRIGSFQVNILPFLMTIINIIASVLYLKGAPLKAKIQLYAMAIFFLVFLYTSPSGLVFYWTLNNVFSLIKTIFYKLKNPKKVLKITFSVVGGLLFLIPIFGNITELAFIVSIVAACLLQLPLIIYLLKEKVFSKLKTNNKPKYQPKVKTPNRKLFLLGCVFATLLLGVLIPSNYIAASPQEYVNAFLDFNPLIYVLSSTCFAAGVFLVWLQVFYWLAGEKGKVKFDRVIWVLSFIMLINYMCFGTNLGVISSALKYDNGFSFSVFECVLNTLLVIILSVALYFIVANLKVFTKYAILSIILVAVVMSGINFVGINKSLAELNKADSGTEIETRFSLSKNSKNVIVLMLDRAMGVYVPYILQERPELREKLAGFTYYSNTISYGGHTNMASPALLGGYEYTPIKINQMSNKSLKDKQNEAHLVMPTIFETNGFDVTVADTVYANYNQGTDLSIFDKEQNTMLQNIENYDSINGIALKGKFTDQEHIKYRYAANKKNFFRFSLMKSMPLLLQLLLYDGAKYHNISGGDESLYGGQKIESISKANGYDPAFLDNYLALDNLPEITKVTDSNTNTFMFMTNDLTHEPMLLDETTYTPAINVDNTEYDKTHADRFINQTTGDKLKINTATALKHYQTNVATLFKLAEWFDYMRKNDVYDNTKIILVSDHGSNSGGNLDIFNYNNESLEFYFPLLMVKDFAENLSSDEKTTVTFDNQFMTNADVVSLAVKDAIDGEVKNPFTGKAINTNEKTAHDQFIMCSRKHSISENNKNQFLASEWIAVGQSGLWDTSKLKYIATPVVKTDYNI